MNVVTLPKYLLDIIPNDGMYAVVPNKLGGPKLIQWNGEDWTDVENVFSVDYHGEYQEQTLTINTIPHVILTDKARIDKHFWKPREESVHMETVPFASIYSILVEIELRVATTRIDVRYLIRTLIETLGLDEEVYEGMLYDAKLQRMGLTPSSGYEHPDYRTDIDTYIQEMEGSTQPEEDN